MTRSTVHLHYSLVDFTSWPQRNELCANSSIKYVKPTSKCMRLSHTSFIDLCSISRIGIQALEGQLEPMSAAQKVILCGDIADAILQYLFPAATLVDDRRTERQLEVSKAERQADCKALARIARVCRALSDTALDGLWRDVNNIYILISIVTPPLYELDSTGQLVSNSSDLQRGSLILRICLVDIHPRPR